MVRGGRLTASQQKAIDSLWAEYGIEKDQVPINRLQVFGRYAELVLEIGFGMGESLVEMARRFPERDFIGIEVYSPGIGNILKATHQHGLDNLRVMQGDAVELMDESVEDESLDRVQIFFPDPWHKKKHHKRRLIQAPFVETLATKLRKGGILHVATDWENYAEQMMEVLSASDKFSNFAGEGQYAGHHDRPETKFERRGQRLGHGVWDIVFEKTE